MGEHVYDWVIDKIRLVDIDLQKVRDEMRSLISEVHGLRDDLRGADNERRAFEKAVLMALASMRSNGSEKENVFTSRNFSGYGDDSDRHQNKFMSAATRCETGIERETKDLDLDNHLTCEDGDGKSASYANLSIDNTPIRDSLFFDSVGQNMKNNVQSCAVGYEVHGSGSYSSGVGEIVCPFPVNVAQDFSNVEQGSPNRSKHASHFKMVGDMRTSESSFPVGLQDDQVKSDVVEVSEKLPRKSYLNSYTFKEHGTDEVADASIEQCLAKQKDLPNNVSINTPTKVKATRVRKDGTISGGECGTEEVPIVNQFKFEPITPLPLKSEKSYDAGKEWSRKNFGYIRHEGKVKSENIQEKSSNFVKHCVGFMVGPFQLRQPLKPQFHMEIINYVFDQQLPESEIIVETEIGNFLTRYQLQTLSPRTWIQDDIINVYMEFKTSNERQYHSKYLSWYLPTRMTSESVTVGSSIEAHVAKLKIRNSYMGNLEHCQKMYIPVNHENHWILFVVRLQHQVLEIWDSLLVAEQSVGYELATDILQNLDRILKEDIIEKMPEGWSFTAFNIKTLTWVPRQPNSYDCGVFVLNFLENKFGRELEGDRFHSDDERVRIVLSLVLSMCNKNRGRLLKLASKHNPVFGTTHLGTSSGKAPMKKPRVS